MEKCYKKNSKRKGNLKKDKRHGLWSLIEQEKKVWEGNYKDGERDGLWTWFNDNGEKDWQGEFKDGKKVGKWTMWQLAYAEIHVTDVLWPDFNSDTLAKALLDYQSRRRRFGGV